MRAKPAFKFSPAVIARARRCGVYQKSPGGAFYADFRPFAARGGRQSALVPDGEHQATKDRSVATALFSKRQQILMELAEAGPRTAMPTPVVPRFGAVIEEHLLEKANDGKSSHGTLRHDEIALRLWFDFFGNCELNDITPLRSKAYIKKRRAEEGRRPGTTLSNATVRNDVHSLSNLLARACSMQPQRWIKRRTSRATFANYSVTSACCATPVPTNALVRLRANCRAYSWRPDWRTSMVPLNPSLKRASRCFFTRECATGSFLLARSGPRLRERHGACAREQVSQAETQIARATGGDVAGTTCDA